MFSAKYRDTPSFQLHLSPLSFSVYIDFRDPFSPSIVQYGQHANPLDTVLLEKNSEHKRETSGDKWYTPRTQLPITQYKQREELDTNNVSIKTVKTLLAQNINIHGASFSLSRWWRYFSLRLDVPGEEKRRIFDIKSVNPKRRFHYLYISMQQTTNKLELRGQ